MEQRYALIATASLNGTVVEEASVPTGRTMQVGNSPDLAVPVPHGMPFVARATWRGTSTILVQDGQGRAHVLEPDGRLEIALGDVEVRFELVPRFELRRTEPLHLTASLPWFITVIAVMLLSGQIRLAWDVFACPVIYPLFGTHCPVPVNLAEGGGINAEYLARLLRRDYDGEDDGAIVQLPPKEGKKITSGYMPAGAKGPITEKGGAAETAREPVRTAEKEAAPPKTRKRKQELAVADHLGTPIPAREQPTEPGEDDDDALGIDTDAAEEEDEAERPAEEEEGWGIPDWMDATPEEREDREVEMMIHLAKRKLRIDPDDPEALNLLAYYQYLAADYDSAETTFDRYIELYPEQPAGYNNKALVYKRRQLYAKEEALYRVALAMDANDETAMNNLAVNLAHQGRFAEALAYMERLELLLPDDPYADLHRAKIHAQMGRDRDALALIDKALEGMKVLDTLHHIEFRQDIRVDPAFAKLRKDSRFRAILREYYGDDTPLQE